MNAEEGELDQEMRLSEPRLWESEFPPEAEKKGMMKEMNSMKNLVGTGCCAAGAGGNENSLLKCSAAEVSKLRRPTARCNWRHLSPATPVIGFVEWWAASLPGQLCPECREVFGVGVVVCSSTLVLSW